MRKLLLLLGLVLTSLAAVPLASASSGAPPTDPPAADDTSVDEPAATEVPADTETPSAVTTVATTSTSVAAVTNESATTTVIARAAAPTTMAAAAPSPTTTMPAALNPSSLSLSSLTEGNSISGTLWGDDDHPVVGVEVMLNTDIYLMSVSTGSDGRFEFVDVPDGTYRVFFHADPVGYENRWWQNEFGIETVMPVVVGAGSTVMLPVQVLPRMGAVVRGTVTASDGTRFRTSS